MKTLFIFFIVLSSLSIHGQIVCDIGTYNFITNTIEGVEKSPYSKIKYVISTEPLNKRIRSVIHYDDFGRVIAIDNKGFVYGYERFGEGCRHFDEVVYTYSDSVVPKEIKMKEIKVTNGIQEDYSLQLTYNKLNKTKSIDYTDDKGEIFLTYNFEYDKKNQLKSIDKDFGYYYEWDNKSRIKKMSIGSADTFYLVNEYNFTYVDNRLATITSIGRLKDNKEEIAFEGIYVFSYKNDKLDKVEYTNIKFGGSSYRLYNYDNDDKVIITYYDEQGIYEYHYECYY
ncbi:hypothetical protein [Psychroserpens sp. NJDZ02]|uniref:hypothetical protein n=1 Tax=Psychroserpens sp. NJDZ02 TaxID=2570561 RepID=UPI0010A93A3B|nr:hypothetical protein [Psychroserpens sp. NJDZ02]QCE43262.1 hypothetical protein E9099_18175 [Psychroserpens sp. NJDZ02]